MVEKHSANWLEREDVGAVTVVRFQVDQLRDDDDTRTIFASLYSLMEAMHRNRLVLDLGRVEYAASLALGKLVMLNRKAQADGGWLGLCRLTPQVLDVLEVTHLKDLFHIHPTEAEALEAAKP
jgi:anti-sigma B factor antagonist